MSSRRRLPLRILASTLLLLGANAPLSAKDREPLPYRLAVTVGYGNPAGPTSLREEIQHLLVADLRAEGCFASVQSGVDDVTGEYDLELSLILDRFQEDIEVEMSIAQRASPGAGPFADQQQVARVRSVFDVQIRTPDREILRGKRFNLENAWRPIYGENPREQARRNLVEDALRRLRSFACKGSARSWQKQLDKAREGAVSR